MIKQIPSANTLNQLFMIRFIAAPSKKINADNEKQQEPSIEKDTTSVNDNKAKTDNETPSQIIKMPKAKAISIETNNEIPSQIIDTPKVRSAYSEYNIKENSNVKLTSNAIMMNAKPGKTNVIQPQAVARQTFVKKANTSIMPKSKIALNNKKLVVNKVRSHDQLVTKNKLHKTTALLPQTGKDKDTVIGIIGALAILLALISFKKSKENKKD